MQPFRIRRLLELQRKVGSEPAVTALLSCFKLYCPHLVSLVVTSTRKRWFPAPDAAWLSRLVSVRRRRADNNNDDDDDDDDDAGSGGGGGRAALKAPVDGRAAIDATDRRSRKRARNDPGIPRAISSTATGGAKGVSMQQITNFKELLDNLEDL